MEFELINPSDPYTFIAEDLETAALVVFILGEGKYGAETEDGNNEVPVFLFGGAEEWYTSMFRRTITEGYEEKKKAVVSALESMMLGHFRDRKRYNAALSAITDPEKKKEFIKKWQDDCNSLNNIGNEAHKLAEVINKQINNN